MSHKAWPYKLNINENSLMTRKIIYLIVIDANIVACKIYILYVFEKNAYSELGIN